MSVKIAKEPVGQTKTPLELTEDVLDVSVTERAAFRTCRRRWNLETLENLTPKAPNWALTFGTGIHAALEALYLDRLDRVAEAKAAKSAHKALDDWHKETDKKTRESLGALFNIDVEEELNEYLALGHGMIDNYLLFDKQEKETWKVLSVEGRVRKGALKSDPPKHSGGKRYPEVLLHESGRLLVPIIDTSTMAPFEDEPALSARIDLTIERKAPRSGLWIVDHKSAASAPSEEGVDFDDQVTGYCYVVWRLTGIIPKGVIYNVLMKQVPKEPRMVQTGLSTAKDQLTTADQYRQALKDNGLMKGSKVTSEKHAECLNALLARGWAPFFRRVEVSRNEHELYQFEQRLSQEYKDMLEASESPKLLYPNPSTWWCPSCSVRSICRAIEDGSDYMDIINNRFMQAEDRKAA
jgi:hypothetical protein